MKWAEPAGKWAEPARPVTAPPSHVGRYERLATAGEDYPVFSGNLPGTVEYHA